MPTGTGHFIWRSIDADDASPIADMLPIGGRTHIIKGDGIYQIELPDSIDPERTNAKLPPTQQRVLAKGANDVLVGRNLLLTRELCRDGILVAHVSVERAMISALEFLKEISAAHDVRIRDFRLTAEGKVAPPTFALDHTATPQAEAPLLAFMKSAAEMLFATFELMLHTYATGGTRDSRACPCGLCQSRKRREETSTSVMGTSRRWGIK